MFTCSFSIFITLPLEILKLYMWLMFYFYWITLVWFAFCIKEGAMAQRIYVIHASSCPKLAWVFFNKNVSSPKRGEVSFLFFLYITGSFHSGFMKFKYIFCHKFTALYWSKVLACCSPGLNKMCYRLLSAYSFPDEGFTLYNK